MIKAIYWRSENAGRQVHSRADVQALDLIRDHRFNGIVVTVPLYVKVDPGARFDVVVTDDSFESYNKNLTSSSVNGIKLIR